MWIIHTENELKKYLGFITKGFVPVTWIKRNSTAAQIWSESQHFSDCAATGLPAVTCPGPAGWRCAGRTAAAAAVAAAAAAAACCFLTCSESAGGSWTCEHWGCVPSQSVSGKWDTQTPGQLQPCAWSCGISETRAGDTGSRTLRI